MTDAELERRTDARRVLHDSEAQHRPVPRELTDDERAQLAGLFDADFRAEAEQLAADLTEDDARQSETDNDWRRWKS